jgi:hypothetical protein
MVMKSGFQFGDQHDGLFIVGAVEQAITQISDNPGCTVSFDCRERASTLRRESRATGLESMNLSNAHSFLVDGPQAHSKLRTIRL